MKEGQEERKKERGKEGKRDRKRERRKEGKRERGKEGKRERGKRRIGNIGPTTKRDEGETKIDRTSRGQGGEIVRDNAATLNGTQDLED